MHLLNRVSLVFAISYNAIAQYLCFSVKNFQDPNPYFNPRVTTRGNYLARSVFDLGLTIIHLIYSAVELGP